MADTDLTRTGAVAHLRLQRVRARNAISLRMADELAAHVAHLASAPGLGALLISGDGPVFCAGADVDELAATGNQRGAYVDQLAATMHQTLVALRALAIPVVAAVTGAVAGGGLGLMLASDLVVAGESCRFVPAYRRVGLTPDAGTTYWLPRMIGVRRSQDLLLRGRELRAPEALDWGLISAMVADDQVGAVAEAWAEDLAAGPREALGQAKKLLGSTWSRTLEEQLQLEQSAVSDQARSPEGAEGLLAFRAHRRPHFARPELGTPGLPAGDPGRGDGP